MSPIKTHGIRVLFLVIGLLLIAGCGDQNSKAAFDADKEAHPAGWLPAGHALAAKTDAKTCAECHGSDFTGGISGVSCLECHVNGNPVSATGCTSCHGNPPNGAAAPNTAGAHAAHNAAPSITNMCGTCHLNAGSGSLKHDNGVVDLNLMPAYNAKSGTAVRNDDGTCSNVSCHGGQTTPAWLSGTTIDVSEQCTACHSFGVTEYNSYVSGQHFLHVTTLGFTCLNCHDKDAVSVNHFTTLDTQAMEGPASATIINDGIRNTYANHTCTPQCHETRDWQ